VTSNAKTAFTTDCRLCPRLADFLRASRQKYPSYYAKPVPSFGPASPRLLIVGLAPGMHGANRTGRPFTGDYAGLLLYRTLYRYGFASADTSTSVDDGLELFDCRITNAVRCVPPENKPTTPEVKTCNAYLQSELGALGPGAIVLALGAVAHVATLRALGIKATQFRFGHGACHELGSGLTLFDSYHCSRYNTQTRRLSETMFHDVFESIRQILDDRGGASALPRQS
jgi:uracil-DNA glycosylase family 4